MRTPVARQPAARRCSSVPAGLAAASIPHEDIPPLRPESHRRACGAQAPPRQHRRRRVYRHRARRITPTSPARNLGCRVTTATSRWSVPCADLVTTLRAGFPNAPARSPPRYACPHSMMPLVADVRFACRATPVVPPSPPRARVRRWEGQERRARNIGHPADETLLGHRQLTPAAPGRRRQILDPLPHR